MIPEPSFGNKLHFLKYVFVAIIMSYSVELPSEPMHMDTDSKKTPKTSRDLHHPVTDQAQRQLLSPFGKLPFANGALANGAF